MDNIIDKMYDEQQNDIAKHNRPIFDFAKSIRDVLTGKCAEKYEKVAIGGSVGLYLSLKCEKAKDIRKVGDIDLYVFENDYDKACELVGKIFEQVGKEKEKYSKISEEMREDFSFFSKCKCYQDKFCKNGFMQFPLQTEVCKIDILFFGEQLEFLCEYVSKDTSIMYLPFIVADKLFAAEWYYRHPAQIVDYKDSGKNGLFKNVNDISNALCYCNSVTIDKFSVKLIGDVRKKWNEIKKSVKNNEINEISMFVGIKEFVGEINLKLESIVKKETQKGGSMNFNNQAKSLS